MRSVVVGQAWNSHDKGILPNADEKFFLVKQHTEHYDVSLIAFFGSRKLKRRRFSGFYLAEPKRGKNEKSNS